MIMKIPNDPHKIDEELNDDGNQIFKSKNQKAPFDNKNRPKKPSNESENHLKSWIIAGVACLVVFIGGFMMTHKSANRAKPVKTEQVAKKRSVKSEKPKQSSVEKPKEKQQSKPVEKQDFK